MKNYGIKAVVGIVVYILLVAVAYVVYDGAGWARYVLLMCVAVGIYALANASLVSIDKTRIKVLTLNPLYKNIHANTSEIDKIIIDTNDYKFRLTLEMKDGRFLFMRANRYRNMKPIYSQLRHTGVPVECNGVDVAKLV